LFFAGVSGRLCKYWLPLIIWMAVIFSASTSLGGPGHTSHYFRPILHWLFPRITEEQFEIIHHVVRKMAHFVEYAILGVLVGRGIQFDPAFASYSSGRKFWFALLCCMLYASTDEFHQKFVATRQPAVQDVLIDTCGSAFGVLANWGLRRRRAVA
jgi:VanZ family protein